MRHLLLFPVLATLAGATSHKTIACMALRRERLNAVFGACFRRAPAVNTLRRLVLALGHDDLESGPGAWCNGTGRGASLSSAALRTAQAASGRAG